MPPAPRFHAFCAAVALAATWATPANGQAVPEPSVTYRLQAGLEVAKRHIAGRAQVAWRNLSPSPVQELQFELPWNARESDQTAWAQGRRRLGLPIGRSRASLAMTSLTVATTGEPLDLLPRARPVTTGGIDDRTVWTIPLENPILPGQQALVDAAWTAPLPDLVDGAGAIRSFVLVTGWYPRFGVLGPEGWTTSATRADGSSTSPLARYEVEIRVPAEWTVGASGAPSADPRSANGITIHRYTAMLARDFAWAAGENLVERRERVVDGTTPIDVRVLVQREHADQADRHLAAAKWALGWYRRELGDFPSPTLTLVDVPLSTENPSVIPHSYGGLATTSTRWVSPWTGPEPEAAVLRAIADVYIRTRPWLGGVQASWLGSPLSAYIAARAFEGTFAGRTGTVDRYFSDMVAWPYIAVPWRRTPDQQPRETLGLMTFERLIGRDTMLEIVRRHVSRWVVAPSTPNDFIAVASSASGRDVSWVVNALATSASYDYAVSSVTTTVGTEGRVLSRVSLQRIGDGIFPIETRVVFDDGSSQIERWDGADREYVLSYDRPSRVVRVDVDPDRVLALDMVRMNNSWTSGSATARAATRWSWRWAVWLQHLLVSYAFLV